MKKISKILVVLFLLGIIGIPTIIYLYHFSGGYSKKSEDWSNFSSFISMYVALCNLIIFIILTYEFYSYTQANDKLSDKRVTLLERPIISFYLDRLQGSFCIHNVGKGAALNIIIRSNIIKDQWMYAFHWYSLRPEQAPELLKWTGNSMEIFATYSDTFGNEYISYMDNNILRIIDLQDKKSKEKYKVEYNKTKLNSVEPKWDRPL